MFALKFGPGRQGVVIGLMAAGLVACSKPEEPKKAPVSVPVTAVVAMIESFPQTLVATGTIVAWEEVPVGSEIGGLTATAVLADEGQAVVQGQVLLRMDDTILQTQLQQALARIASAQASLNQTGADLARARELQEQGYLARSVLDARTAAQQASAANLASARAAEAEIRAQLQRTIVKAPVAGLISQRTVVKGQIVQASSGLFRIVREGQLELNAQVPEASLGQIVQGAPARVVAESAGTVSGRVRIITPQINEQTRTGLARVRLSATRGFRPGMFARAEIDLPTRSSLTVPQASVLYRDGKAGLFVVDPTLHARFKPVETGGTSKDKVEILSGLNGGEKVVVRGAGFLADGDLVKFESAGKT